MLTSLEPLQAILLTATAATLVVWMLVGLTRWWPGRVFQSMMLLTVVASVCSVVFSQRKLTLPTESLFLAKAAEATEAAINPMAKVPLVALIALSVALCIAWTVGLREDGGVALRPALKGKVPQHDFLLAFSTFYVAFSLLPILFGQHYFFHISLIYPLFVFLALFLSVQNSRVDPVTVVKQSLALLVVGSLVSALAVPGFALQPGYTGLVGGFSWRLWGIAANANTLGSAACAMLVLELAEPARRRWLHWMLLTAAAVTLVMTQSKTSLAAALLGGGILAVWRIAERLRLESEVSSKSPGGATIALILAGCMATGIVGAWLIFADDVLPRSMLDGLNSRAVTDLSTMTGRIWIWDAAIQAGMENLFFGQGAGMWEIENRLRLNLSGAVHAHNLFLEVFSRSGLVGLAGLFVFLYFLITYSVRAAKVTRGGSIALLGMFLMRSITEVPLQPNAILGAEFFALAALFFYVVDRGMKRTQEVSDPWRSKPQGAAIHDGDHRPATS
ncbi:MAG: O-antigen polymerase [Herminiimonas sp.]|nr:O-antigen polymerase [Herminiimonas sp.]